MANKVIVQQFRSNELSNGNAKLPTSGDFPSEPQKKYGILAINYHEDQETISTLNDGNEVVAFNYNLNIDTTQNENPTLTEDVFNAIKTAKSISFNNEWFITHRAIDTQKNTLNLFGGKVDGEKIDYIKIAVNRENYTVEIKSGSGDFLDNTVIPNINQQLIVLNEAIESVSQSAISVKAGDGIVISGDGTEKTISTNVQLKIVNEKLQIVDANNNKILAEVDASAFVVDGMLSSAEIVSVDDETELPEGVELSNGKYIKLSWNTDSGKTDTYIPVADLISEHQVNAGEDVAGEFVTVTTNVVESTDENGVKVSTVNVTVDDTAVKTALDTKADKTTVDAYTVNGKAISSEPVLTAEDIYTTKNESVQSVITNLNSSSHTHDNKAELDKIDVGDITKYSVNGLKFQKEGDEYKINIEGENINVPYPYDVVPDMSIFDAENENNVNDLLITIDEGIVASLQNIGSILNYTVNYKKISQNPVLSAGDIEGTYTVEGNEEKQTEKIEDSIQSLKDDSHTHDNKTVLDSLTQDVIDDSHTHDNKDFLDNIETKVNGKNVTCTIPDTATDGYLKTYIIKQGDVEVVTIDIPKDLVVQKGEVITAETKDVNDYPQANLIVGEKYIQLTIQNQEKPIFIAVKDLVDVYGGSDYIEIGDNNSISLKFETLDFALVNNETNVKEYIDTAIQNVNDYTVNGKKISEKPVLSAGDIDITTINGINSENIQDALEEIQSNIGDFYTKTQVNSLITSEKDRAVAEEDSIKQALSDTEEVISNTLVTFKDSIGLDEYGKFIIDSQETNVKTVIEDLQTDIDKVNYSKDINYAVNTSMNFISRCPDDVFTITTNQYTLPTYYYAKGLKTGDVIHISFDIEIDNTVWNYTTEDTTEKTGEISIQFGTAYNYMAAHTSRFTASGKYHSTYSTTVTNTKDITEDICCYLYIRYSYVKSIDNTQPMVKISNLCIIKGEEDKGWFPSVFDNEYNIGCNTHTLTYSEVVPTSKRLCYVNINSASSTVGMQFRIAQSSLIADKDTTALIHNGQENHFIFYNSTAQDVTLLFPNRDNIVLLSGSNITISANSYAEVNCLMVDEGRTDGLTNQGKMYIRAMV